MAIHAPPNLLDRPRPLRPAGRDGAPPPARISGPAWVTLGAVAVLTVVVLPFCRYDVGRQPAFLPVVVAAVLMVDVISAYLLGTRFRDTGDIRLLVMALAYVWSVVIVVGYAGSFPGFVSDPPPLTSWPSAAPYLYLAWHIGFPVLLGVAWGYPKGWDALVEAHRRRRVALAATGACAGAAALFVAFVALLGHRFLPILIVGTDTSRMTRLAGPPGMVLAVAAAVVVSARIRRRQGPERWALVAAWVCVADLVLTFLSGHRYSLGWFVGRGLTVLGSSLVFMAMLGEFTALQRRLIRERGRLTRQTRTDDLTGLANRFALRERLTDQLDSAAGGWLMLLDLDRFKAVNDSYGHEAGDAVIVETARRLTALGGAGQMVARLGGDEFAVVFDAGTSAHDVDLAAAAILTEIRRPYELVVAGARARAFIGMSIGLTELGPDRSASDVLRESDLALYRAKDAGRGCVATYDEELRVRAVARLRLETTIREALDGGEFVPHLQPIAALADGTTRGYELLLRLTGADGRATLPADLIEVAEETGLIVDIDTRMLLAAARLAAGDDAGTLGVLGVNLSARTLVHPGLAEILAAVAAIGPPAGRLAVEITERVLLDDTDGAGAAIASLRAAGIRVGLDDFGTGYSALAYLRRYPLDFLKIDRSFVADLDGPSGPAAIFQAVMALAGALGLEVIAEGVETPAQHAALRGFGCTRAQGYLLGRPAPIDTWVPGHDDAGLCLGPPTGDSGSRLPPLQPPADRRAVRSVPRPG